MMEWKWRVPVTFNLWCMTPEDLDKSRQLECLVYDTRLTVSAPDSSALLKTLRSFAASGRRIEENWD